MPCCLTLVETCSRLLHLIGKSACTNSMTRLVNPWLDSFTRLSSHQQTPFGAFQKPAKSSKAPMARVAPTPVGLHKLRPSTFLGHQSLSLINPSIRSQIRSRRCRITCCQTSPKPTDDSSPEKPLEEPGSANDDTSQDAGVSANASFPEYPTKNVNRQIAVVSALAALGLFFSSRLDLGVSLKDLSAAALPYEEALSNGKPTVVEFYADWCEVCRELAPDLYKVEQQYKDRVNFVMLNVDNTKWEQELDEFGVEGIPHFAFLDKFGNEEGNIVGRFPRQYFLENVNALARGEASVPHSQVVGQYSKAESRKVHQVVDPRSHG
ncbi:thioredoxin-like protein HCF164, chloroplastic [Diospyros lotus]|uniref:thioredoxin-like protein HCF164, chloroplastic n=1 Tax=Diospyros lotus TaxID=55363 RepID=UPI002251465A|nr:thioredoxin-like protein HCF164, chloroplastic [Diospyros lotus]